MEVEEDAGKRYRYHCGRDNCDLTETDVKRHHCKSRKKGRRKGKKCKYLVILSD